MAKKFEATFESHTVLIVLIGSGMSNSDPSRWGPQSVPM